MKSIEWTEQWRWSDAFRALARYRRLLKWQFALALGVSAFCVALTLFFSTSLLPPDRHRLLVQTPALISPLILLLPWLTVMVAILALGTFLTIAPTRIRICRSAPAEAKNSGFQLLRNVSISSQKTGAYFLYSIGRSERQQRCVVPPNVDVNDLRKLVHPHQEDGDLYMRRPIHPVRLALATSAMLSVIVSIPFILQFVIELIRNLTANP